MQHRAHWHGHTGTGHGHGHGPHLLQLVPGGGRRSAPERDLHARAAVVTDAHAALGQLRRAAQQGSGQACRACRESLAHRWGQPALESTQCCSRPQPITMYSDI